MVALLLLFLLGEWVSLFDGRSLDGWLWSVDPHPPKPAWTVENGTLRTTPGSGVPVYLLTRDSFRDFEFEFEWKMDPGGNSGVKVQVPGVLGERQA
jgi:hypothetical protein